MSLEVERTHIIITFLSQCECFESMYYVIAIVFKTMNWVDFD